MLATYLRVISGLLLIYKDVYASPTGHAGPNPINHLKPTSTQTGGSNPFANFPTLTGFAGKQKPFGNAQFFGQPPWQQSFGQHGGNGQSFGKQPGNGQSFGQQAGNSQGFGQSSPFQQFGPAGVQPSYQIRPGQPQQVVPGGRPQQVQPGRQ